MSHRVTRVDWEVWLDEIYKKTIQGRAGAIVIVSNTQRSSPQDDVGRTCEGLVFRLKKNLEEQTHHQLKQFNYAQFIMIFESLGQGGQDYYRSMSVLTREVILFPLVNEEEKKALVILEGNVPDTSLQRSRNAIEAVLK